MRIILFGFLLAVTCCFKAGAQRDSISSSNKSVLNSVDPKAISPFLSDSAISANREKFVEDSVALAYLIPDSAKMKSPGLDSILKIGANTPLFEPGKAPKRTAAAKNGAKRKPREDWVIAVVLGLLIYTGLLNLFFGSDLLKSVIQSFYSKRTLTNPDREAGLVNSWAFAGLFLLFCITFGLILYQLTAYYNKTYPVSGFNLFMLLSGIAGVLVFLKFILLKFIGFIFDISAIVSEYLAILNLTYFSLAFVLLAVALCFSLLANRLIPQLFIISIGLTAVILVWQYLRGSLNIISDFRFHKFYLFVYLCALEICPVLILIKALNI
jgi:hypothetical protein